MRSILDLRKTSEASGLSSGDEQIVLSDGEVSIATSRAEKLFDRSFGGCELAGILRKSSLNKNEAGLTIVEIIVALFVGAILVGSINLIYTNQVFITQSAKARALSNAFAEGKVESLRSSGYLTLTDGTTNITSELPVGLTPPKNATMEITTPITGVKRVELTIEYFSQGEQRTETYTTNIGELGAGQQ